MKSVIVGTAGHIDHGKSALVRALTGIDPDRLEEEKRRGITIDLGFANLDLQSPGGEPIRIGLVDVPGHERFVRNMLAGVGGIDLVLLVVAADESVKPQTREHFEICRLLSVQRGITVLTKSDLVDAETLEVVTMEVAEFLAGSFLDPATSPIIPVSSKTGAGLDQLKRELARLAAEVPAKDSSAVFRLPIDRVFTMKGFGTVVTGTLVSGTVHKEQEVEVHPTGKRLRVRGVQVHGHPAEEAIAGQRTALNLAGVETTELARGMMLTPPEMFHPVARLGVQLDLLPSAKPLRQYARVHLHAFAAEAIARVTLLETKQLLPGESGFARLKLDRPLLLFPGDRFILRQYSPVITIGGGRVLDAGDPPIRIARDQSLPFLADHRQRQSQGSAAGAHKPALDLWPYRCRSGGGNGMASRSRAAARGGTEAGGDDRDLRQRSDHSRWLEQSSPGHPFDCRPVPRCQSSAAGNQQGRASRDASGDMPSCSMESSLRCCARKSWRPTANCCVFPVEAWFCATRKRNRSRRSSRPSPRQACRSRR